MDIQNVAIQYLVHPVMVVILLVQMENQYVVVGKKAIMEHAEPKIIKEKKNKTEVVNIPRNILE